MTDEELIEALAKAIATSIFDGVLPSPANVADYRTEAVAALAVIAPELVALRAENARLREALNGLVVAIDWETTAIIGGADDVVTRAQILQACARAAMGESEK